jgi:hypothetical protein
MASTDSLVPAEAKNVGGYDRVARAVGAVVFAALAVALLAGGRTATGALAGVASAGLGFNAATQFCGLNAVLGVDTCARTDGDCE